MPEVQTLDQKRAAYAWQRQRDYTNKDYVTLIKGAPALVMTNGLMQALAYYQNKNEDGKKLVGAVGEWLTQGGLSRSAEFSGLMQCLHKASAEQYMLATREVLEILKWMKQIGSAVVETTRASQDSGTGSTRGRS